MGEHKRKMYGKVLNFERKQIDVAL